ncbi:MAG: alpha/beta hydrolase [Gemmatimonadota bacterium]|nr:alpha/beta hydrolase [Gemmatimonadota bacterium]MDH3421707.1 alpha/beta hydrolase [Gemmatimonadota bacterium]
MLRSHGPTLSLPLAAALMATAIGVSSPVAVAAQSWASVAGSDALSVDHYVPVVSKAPSMEGEIAQIYVRERVTPGTALRSQSLEGNVVIFVHGAGTPAEVSFDAPGASWMGYLAEAGYDVFSMDMTGYGRSTRPSVMNDPCNLSEGQQRDLVPALLMHTCAPSYGFATTTIESDWHDLDAVVEYVRQLRGVNRVHLAAWSLGGPRAGGYASRHPEKVASAILLSPAYGRNRSSSPPAQLPAPGAAFTKQSKADFESLWDRQLGCPAQYEPAVRESVWTAMLESDPVGATWGTGVRRAPRLTTWGWGQEEVARQQTPMLLIAPETDGQVSPASVVALYEDLGATNKVLIHLACSSHNAMWETNRMILFEASLDWLRTGAVQGTENGELRLGS